MHNNNSNFVKFNPVPVIDEKLIQQEQYWILKSNRKNIANFLGDGWQWEPFEKVWKTNNLISLRRFLRLTGYDASLLQDIEKKIIESIALSASTEISDYKVPVPDGLQYLPHQLAAVKYAENKDNLLIADEMGLGKTIEAIAIINFEFNRKGVESVLVICPASLKINWARELEKWLVPSELKNNIHILSSKSKFNRCKKGVFVINYEALRLVEGLNEKNWDILIYDEAHYLKSFKAQRTKIALSIPAKKTIALTGTPILNRPVELFPLLTRLDPHNLGKNYFRYVIRYCNAYKDAYGWRVTGSSNLKELQVLLRTSLMIRRTKQDVLKNLPEKIRQVIVYPAEGKLKEVVKRENLLLSQIDKEILVASAEQLEKLFEGLSKIDIVSFNELSKVRKELGMLKVPFVLEQLNLILESTEKPIVVFTHHQCVAEAIAKHFKVEPFIGSTPVKKRQIIVDQFRKGESKLFIGTLQSAGYGLNLETASTIVFAELDWVPAKLIQAEDRAYRIGQKNNLLIYYLVVEKSLDVKLAEYISQKYSSINQLLEVKHL